MAVEVDLQDYEFIPPRPLAEVLAEVDAFNEELALHPFDMPPERKVHPNFLHNPIHDLESLWWIAVYFVLQNEAVRGKLALPAHFNAPWDSDLQLDYAKKLFSDTSERRLVMKGNGRFMERVRQVVHPSMRGFAHSLEALRRELARAYCEVEKNVDARDYSYAATLYAGFEKVFSMIAKADDLQHVSLQQLTYRPIVAPNYPVVEAVQNPPTVHADDGDVVMSSDGPHQDPTAQHTPAAPAAPPIPHCRYNLRPRKNLPRRGLR